MMRLRREPTWLNDMIWLGLFIGGLFFLFLGTRPLFTPDEGRYAEIAREMVTRHDYLTPYLNGIKYFEKPILYYWLEAGVIKLFGLNLWSLRSLNAFLGLLTCLATYATGRYFYDRIVGLTAALILATSLLFFVMVHMISLDLPVTFFLTITLFGFLVSIASDAAINKRVIYLCAASAAAAVLTKGLIGMVFPGAIISIYLTVTQRWARLKTLPMVRAFLFFCALTLPWHYLVNLKNPEFFYFYIIEQHFLRYLNPDIGHYQPAWFFIPYLIIGFFPWILLLPSALHKILKDRKKTGVFSCNIFLISWIGFIFIFFSFSKSKLIPYILPIFPPLALLIAFYLAPILKSSLKAKRIFGVLIAFLAIAMITFITALPKLDHRSIWPLVKAMPLLQIEDRVITYNQYFQDLPFYLQRHVMVLNWHNELAFGMQHQKDHDWMINDATFWRYWQGPERVYVFINRDEFVAFNHQFPHAQPYEIDRTPQNVLMTNQPLAAKQLHIFTKK